MQKTNANAQKHQLDTTKTVLQFIGKNRDIK